MFGLHAVLHPVEKKLYGILSHDESVFFLYYHAGRVAFLVPLFQHYKILHVRYTDTELKQLLMHLEYIYIGMHGTDTPFMGIPVGY
jgi:hypothetical protein